MKRKIIVITGATGFLGTSMTERFVREGWHVRAGVRDSKWFVEQEHVTPFACHLPDKLDTEAFEGADTVIHAAYVTRYATLQQAKDTNIRGTVRVLEAARKAGVPHVIFMSSCSAHVKALGFYGKSKYHLEGRLRPESELAIRPGLVLGHGGLFARMVKTIRYSKIVPLFDRGRQQVQTIHVEDLVEAIYRAVERRLTGCLIVAHPRAMPMYRFLREVSRHLGYKPKFFSFSSRAGVSILRFLERQNLRISFSSENLLGLRSMTYQDPRESLRILRLKPRSTEQSLRDLFSQDTVPGKSLTREGHPVIRETE